MLANDNAVEGLVLGKGGVIDSLPRGGIHISSSTISVALSAALAKAHAKAGQRFVAAPVFGRPDVAERNRGDDRFLTSPKPWMVSDRGGWTRKYSGEDEGLALGR